ncbi:olfactory receptor 5AN1-like [Takifugu flavidus]|uniref:olfactory receptor 5AN1-like n=1 Tax=Takifugu flavidus TaxID=433684 RepID=UPI002544A6E6|nr:olfactory receptor 5AN1-like [Takifugu flavidus]
MINLHVVMDNASEVMIFTLSGFNSIVNYRFTLFAITFVCYCVIVQVNVTLIVAIIVDKSLHEPMYIFLCNLCINSLYGTAAFYPKFLIDILSTSHVISYAGCLVQSFAVNSSACADFSLLVLMAYDRYVAICRPLVYHSVMNPQRVSALVFAAWILPLGQIFITTTSTSTLTLCGSHLVRMYCINYVIRRLECTISITTAFFSVFIITFYFCHFLLVTYSYFYIMRTCLTGKEERMKFLQTCLPHLMSFIIVAMCLLFDVLHVRLRSEKMSESAQNFIAIQFLLFPPLINPLIYGLKLTKVRNRIERFLCRKS